MDRVNEIDVLLVEGSPNPDNISSRPSHLVHLESNPWIPYVGDCKALDTFLDSKTNKLWLFPKFLNALFRGISQVLFANNPLTGLIILLALFWSDVTVGLATTAAATTAILTSLLMRQPLGNIRAGLTTYNAVLVGCVTASLWFPVYGQHLTPKLWAFIIVGSALSVFVTSGLANILSSNKFPLPCLTLPFNVVNLLIFICLMPRITPPMPTAIPTTGLIANQSDPGVVAGNGTVLPAVPDNINVTELNRGTRDAANASGEQAVVEKPVIPAPVVEEKAKPEGEAAKDTKEENKDVNLDWGKTFAGIIISMGQVFAVENLLGSILIFVAVMIYSPILCVMCLFGAILATLTGIIFTPGPDFTTVYTGIWGYNGILSAAAVGGFFIVMTCHSFFTAAANVLFTVMLQHALVLIFAGMRLPVFTLPFVLSTLLFLSVSTSGDQLPRVTNITFPEMHRYEYLESVRAKKSNKKAAEEIGEEKELVLKDVKIINEENTESAQDPNVITTNGQDK